MRTGRHYGLTMEPRGLMAEWDAAKGQLTVSGAAKVPFFNRRILAAQIGLPDEQIEMIENDVGGGFGARGEFYPEDFLIPFAARHVNRPVKWIEDRRENLMATNHAREAECDLEIACERDGTILALRGEVHTDIGAYMRTNGAVGARNVAQFMSGPYRVPHVQFEFALWMTNKTPVGTYRGPGRFEANFFRERLFDMAADDLGIDRVEFRRKNLITAHELPYPIAHRAADRRQRRIRQRRLPRDARPLPEGVRLGGEVEAAGQADRRQLPRPRRRLLHRGRRGRPEGNARGSRSTTTARSRSIMGSSSVGQGVETVFAQIAADALEMPIERIRHVYHGSTAYVSDGYGAYHSRSIVMGGSARARRRQQFQGGAARGRRRSGSAAPSPTSRSTIDKVSGRRPLAAAAGARRASPPKARSSTRSTPTATARTPPMSRSMPAPATSRSSTTSWCRTSAAPSIR